MKKLTIIILALLSNNVFSWTLSRSVRSGYQTTTTVNIYIGSNNCSNAGITASELKSYTEEAVAEFWNTVSTSALRLNVIGISSNSLGDSDDLNAALNKVPTNSIFVGCNANSSIFTSNNILAVGSMGCSGTDCRGAVIVNNVSGTNMSAQDNQGIKSTMAHELGHAIGIGHTSVKYALMYYDSTGVVNKSLAQDDIDAVSYLYPNDKKLGGIAGSCSTIAASRNQTKDFLMAILLGLFSILGLKFLKKRA